MEEQKDLNKILLGDDNDNQPSKAKKVILTIIIAIVIILVALVVVWKFNQKETPKEEAINTDTSIQKMDAVQGNNTNDVFDNNDDFENMSIDDMSKTEEENKFDKIVQDIKEKQLAKSQEASQNSPDEIKPEPKEEKPTPAPQAQNNTPDPQLKAMESIQENKKPAKETKPLALKPKEEKKVQEKSVQKPKPQPATPKPTNAKNGSVASPGHYLQIGAFTKTPNKEFLDKISKYPYRIQKSTINGQSVTKYLIGPYQSRTDANRDILKITTEMGKPMYLQVK
ncbi:SPOR domain-containing protein [Helicobacter sp. 11S02596-1]|uniref:SPOR domain-containing protein n=1 Tax=Helicobacter sp. 11S02596-1 TaxID=1476194 RepID=UPI000BA59A21|nr:SPOR domain-containing protein [Helicobacter sp. 11S02596-1]PAF42454.1 hypothetical protein BJI48_06490 [Helicobacter sp. 11S02596-1]